MNKRMKKKALKTKGFTRKERLRNQRKTIHRLFEQRKELEKIIDTKHDTILMLKAKLQDIGQDAAAANKAYAVTESELQEIRRVQECSKNRVEVLSTDVEVLEEKLKTYMDLYSDQCKLTEHFKAKLANTIKQLDEERAKPLWKKVFRG